MPMRQAVALYQDIKNLSWPANGMFQGGFGLRIDYIVLCLLSILTNAFVIMVSVLTKSIGNYKFFLSNLALCDILFSSSVIGAIVSKHVHFVGNYSMSAFACSLETKPMYAFGFCTIFALPLASVNRYLTIVHNNDHWFSRRRTFFFCSLTYIPLLYPVIDFAFAQDVADNPDCRYTLFTKFLPEILIFPCIVGFMVLVYCNLKLIIGLRTQFRSIPSVVKLSKSTVVNEKSILIATFLQAAFPIIFTLPMAISLLRVMIGGWTYAYAAKYSAGPVSISENQLASTMILLNPLSNSLITLIVVKHYRIALIEWTQGMKGLFARNNRVHTASMEMTISPETQAA